MAKYLKQRGKGANEWIKARRGIIKEAVAEGRIAFVNEILVGRCEECGQWKPLTPDHIKKRSQGGTHTRANIQFICVSCHQKLDNMAGSKKQKGKKPKWALAHPCVNCNSITIQYICHICGQPSTK